MLLSRLCPDSEYALLVPYSMSFLLLFKELQTPSQKKLLVKVGRINREAIVCSLNGADSCFLFWLAGSEEEITGFQSLFLPVALLHFIWPSSFRLAIAILNSAPPLFKNTLWAIVCLRKLSNFCSKLTVWVLSFYYQHLYCYFRERLTGVT